MKRIVGLICLFCFCCCGLAAAAEPIRVLIVTGGHGYEEEPFYAAFDAMEGIQYDKTAYPEAFDLLKPGLEKKYDVVLAYDMCTHDISPEQAADFIALLKQGGIGYFGLHHTLSGHRKWEEYTDVLGGKYFFEKQTRDGKDQGPSSYYHDQDLKIEVADREHPITKGLEAFDIHDETYKDFYVSPKVRVLLTTDHPKNNREIAWTHVYGKTPVFYFMLGHDHLAYENPGFREIIARGIRWLAEEKEKSR